ncbi:poly-beta-1,6-N-acetyl-D-glucosamine biosynthesis protein PgaD [Phascolarctobacterium sp.]
MSDDNKDEYPIIYKFESRSRLVVWIERIIMVVCTCLLWFYFITHLYNTLSNSVAVAKTVNMFIFLLIIALLEMVLLLLWQFYNKIMFGNKNRRKGFAIIDDSEVASVYGITEADLYNLRKSKKVAVLDVTGSLYWQIVDKVFLLSRSKKINIGVSIKKIN